MVLKRARDRVRDLPPTLRRIRGALLIGLGAINVAFPLLLFLAGLPQPWGAFYGEESPINWFSSVQCAVLGTLGFSVAFLTRYGIEEGTERVGRSWPWFVLAFGFLFLSVDEQFMIHERVREELLVPHEVFTGISWLHAGDVVLIAYAALGAILALALFADLRRYRLPLVLFATALMLIGVAAVQDSLNVRVLKQPGVRHVQIIAEETAEIWAQALFGFSLIVVFFEKLRASLGRPA